MKHVLFTALLFGLAATSAQSADKMKNKMPEPTPVQRQEMAANHEKMAACLRSEKPIMDCHKEMIDSCKKAGASCPMMGAHKMHGKWHEHEESEKSDK